MEFIVEINDNNIFPVITLKNITENTVAEIYSFGALLNKFSVKNSTNIIDGYTSPEDAKENIKNNFKSAKLNPFVCRLANCKYKLHEKEYIINKFCNGTEAIHGLLFDVDFDVIDSGTDETSAYVSLQYNYTKKNEGFPFNYLCTITYRLTQHNGLLIETTVKNKGNIDMPVCDGWHPYFTLGGKIDESFLKINADKIIEYNEKLLPTQNVLSYKKFQQPEIIGDALLDNCFILKENNQSACVLSNTVSGLTLTIKPDYSYPYLQVYIPQHRNSIAIENLSSIPDAFNNKIGLKILKAGESISFKTNFMLEIKL